MRPRQIKIVEILGEHERLEVSRIADLTGASQVTVRKDLGELETLGLIKRSHGYAVLTSTYDMHNRMAIGLDVKTRIAGLAASLVANGETIMIESGSTSTLLAYELCKTPRGITIVTNSAFIADYVKHLPGAGIVLLGGNYQPESQVTVGPITKLCAKEFFVTKLFFGTDGFTEEIGYTCINHVRAETVRAMSENAGSVIVLTESRKFGQRSVAFEFSANEVDTVITDADIPMQVKSYLEQHGARVLTVEV